MIAVRKLEGAGVADTLFSIQSKLDGLLKHFATEIELTNDNPVDGNVEQSAFGFRAEDKPRVGDKTKIQIRRPARSGLPDPRWVKQIIREREIREKYFDPQLFADPAWDMILDLLLAQSEFRRISVTSLCTASKVPPTTALRWIAQMVEMGVFRREEDDQDKRRAFISLSESGLASAASYFNDQLQDRNSMR